MEIGIQVSSVKPLLLTEEQVSLAFRRMAELGCKVVQLQWVDPSVSPEFIAKTLEENGIVSVSVQDFYDLVTALYRGQMAVCQPDSGAAEKPGGTGWLYPGIAGPSGKIGHSGAKSVLPPCHRGFCGRAGNERGGVSFERHAGAGYLSGPVSSEPELRGYARVYSTVWQANLHGSL